MFFPPQQFFSHTAKLLHKAATLLPICALLGGCTTGPDFRHPLNTLDAAVLTPRTAMEQPVELSPDPPPENWWSLFGDTLLNDLQARASHSNLDLQTATARVAQSRAMLGITASQLYPHLGFGADYSRTANSANGTQAASGASDTAYNLWQTGFDTAWEIDFWGRNRRDRESAWAALQASGYAREVTRAAVSAEIAHNYLMLRGVQTQLDIAGQNLEIAEHAVKLTHSREQNGVATRFDTASARAQQATVEALIPELMQHRDALMNALALMLGEPPRRLDAELGPALPFPALPGKIPVGLPSELARRRPDILQAEARLHETTAAIGVATADFYPRISLTGSLGLQALNRNDLGNWSSRNFSIGPTLYLPIFEGGRLKSTLALTEAKQQEAAIAYQQTVLQAWHEIDNALNAFSAEQRRHAALQTAFEQNRQAFLVAQRAYQEGAGDYLSVLTAQRNLLNSQITLADSTTTASLTLVMLYKALGGGWNPDTFEFAASAENTTTPSNGQAAVAAPRS